MTQQPLPRRDLREKAFRRYELYMSRAIHKDIWVDPKAELSLSSTTFKARFDDAKIAQKKFKYSSDLIPSDFNLDLLICSEFEDGRVLIQNKTREANEKPKDNEITEEVVVTLMNRIARKEVKDTTLPCSATELLKILAFAEKHPEIDCIVVEQNGKAFFYTV